MLKPTSALIRTLWDHVVPEPFPNGERIELLEYDGGAAVLPFPGEDDGWWVSAWRHKPDEYGSKKRFEQARVFIPCPPEWAASTACADHYLHHLGLLVAMLRPKRPPKGWRLFGRRRPC